MRSRRRKAAASLASKPGPSAPATASGTRRLRPRATADRVAHPTQIASFSWSGGLARRREEEPPSLPEWIGEAEALAPTYTPPDAGKYPEDTWERVTLTGVHPGPAPWLPRAEGCVRAAVNLDV